MAGLFTRDKVLCMPEAKDYEYIDSASPCFREIVDLCGGNPIATSAIDASPNYVEGLHFIKKKIVDYAGPKQRWSSCKK